MRMQEYAVLHYLFIRFILHSFIPATSKYSFQKALQATPAR